MSIWILKPALFALGDEDYDPRTLYVPSSHWSKFTPFERQFWEVKSKNWDSVS